MSTDGAYDVAVIGGTLGATLCAALMARRGHRVLLLGQDELRGPAAGALTDLIVSEHESRVMQHIHRELGVLDRLRLTTRGLEPTLQAVFDDERLDLVAEREALTSELTRVFRAAAEPGVETFAGLDAAEGDLARFLESAGPLPPAGYFAQQMAGARIRRNKTVGRRLGASDRLDALPAGLSALAVGLLPFATHRAPTPDPAEGAVARVFSRVLRGLAAPGDRQGLRTLFLEVAEREGAKILDAAEVTEVTPMAGRFEVAATTSRSRLAAPIVVDASSALATLEVLPPKVQKKLSRTQERARPVGALHGITLTVDAAVVPPVMAHLALLIDGAAQRRAEAAEPPILVVNEACNEIPTRARLTAWLYRADGEPSDLDTLEALVRPRLEALIPFLADGDPQRTSPHQTEGATVRCLPHPLFDADLDPSTGFTGIPCRTPIKNLLLSGPAILPGLGHEGQYLAALQVADEVDRLAGRRRWPKTLGKRLDVGRDS